MFSVIVVIIYSSKRQEKPFSKLQDAETQVD